MKKSTAINIAKSARLMVGLTKNWRKYRKHMAYFLPEIDQLNTAEQGRLIDSALKFITLGQVFSDAIGDGGFRCNQLLRLGLCAALFDDLVEEQLEYDEVIKELIQCPEKVVCQSLKGIMLAKIFSNILQDSPPWQQQQLQKYLFILLEAELATLHFGCDHFTERGSYAIMILLTVLGVREDEVDLIFIQQFGLYQQLLDDFQDINEDIRTGATNFFVKYSDFDLDAFYKASIRPGIRSIFLGNKSTCFQPDKLLLFTDQYHAWLMLLCRYKHRLINARGLARQMCRYVFPFTEKII